MSFELTPDDPRYPSLLKKINDPPQRLWCEGDDRLLADGFCMAIVGARQCTPYGEKVAFEMAKGLVQNGVTIVSGLAFGIDAQGHRGALAGGGKTIAVLGFGIDIPPPLENLELRKKIAQSGLVISEFPPGTRGASWTFPRRNRIISGLSHGVVVVEAGKKSGSLITAEWALQQDREVFAVPGSIASPLSAGTHRLIQNGAKLVTSVKDILEEFRFSNLLEALPAKEKGCSDEENKILTLISDVPRHMDELIESSGYSVEKMSSLLVELEIGGKIKSLPGGRYLKSEGF